MAKALSIAQRQALARKYPICFLNRCGTPKLRTISVTTDTTGTSVTYNLCPYQWVQLPDEGLILLNVVHTPEAGSDAFLVYLATRNNNVVDGTSTTTSSRIPLLNGSGDQMTSEEITAGNKYLIYYDKCNGIFQVVNHIVVAAAPGA